MRKVGCIAGLVAGMMLSAGVAYAQPDFTSQHHWFGKTVENTTPHEGGKVFPGDVLRYTVRIENGGNERADEMLFEDLLQQGLTYVPGSLWLTDSLGSENLGDATDDGDRGEYVDDGWTRTIFVRIGTGADGTHRGYMMPGDVVTIRFEVRINASTLGWVENQAFLK